MQSNFVTRREMFLEYGPKGSEIEVLRWSHDATYQVICRKTSGYFCQQQAVGHPED